MQRSYLSNVLSGRGNFSDDQLYLVVHELNLPPKEQAYLQGLANLDRCQVPARKRELVDELEQKRNALVSSAVAIKTQKMLDDGGSRAEHYSDPMFPLVHMGFCIKKFQKNPPLLRDRLGLSVESFGKAIDILEKCGAIRLSDEGFELLEEAVHLGPQSSLAKTHALSFRLLAMEKYRSQSDKGGYFFTASFTGNEVLRKRLKDRLLKVLEEWSKEIEEEACDDIYHIDIDLFRV